MQMIDFTKELFLDGGMGSLLLERANLPIGYCLERLNIENPDIVKSVHNDYLDAGANIIYTNTFGLNRYNFKNSDLKNLLLAGINLAKTCAKPYNACVALDIGPLGKLIGDGGISFDQAYDAFKEIVTQASETSDLIVIETMTNLLEARIATLAALENSKLPVMVSMSFEKNGISVFGNPIECFAETIGSMDIAAIGINCTLGAKEMLPLAKRLLEFTNKPVFVKPNAGMPSMENGKTVYHTTMDDFSDFAALIKKAGVKIIGGCCGTTPSFISKTKQKCDNVVAIATNYQKRSSVCSAYKYLEIDSPKVVGERINPTGKKAFQKALREEDWGYILAQAIEQEEAKADILDVNVGLNGIDEPYILAKAVENLQNITTLPLQIDTTDINALKCALRIYNGKAIINSVNGSEESLTTVLPLAKKYGAAVIGLTIDEKGISQDINERVNIAKKIINRCQDFGISKKDIYIDTLTMAEASGKGNALLTLKTLSGIKKLGVKTALGISNISFGMPSRMDINAKFMELAITAGLDLCIINPNLIGMSGSSFAQDFLLAKDGATEKYIEFALSQTEKTEKVTTSEKTLFDAVFTGQKELAKELSKELIKTMDALDIVSKYLIPALDKVGEGYENKRLFLPQLIASAQAAKEAFSVLDKVIVKNEDELSKVFVLATIKGDIHDIGKNIVKSVVANYGYKVVDLGKDVDFETILSAVKKYYPCVLGLSALMTTTATNIEIAIKLVKEKYDVPILVGGAVFTREYATKIGGIYCVDANDAVKKLKSLYN
jgi:5-methyltetrahydrofolate--homocysteine methyltransferase